MADFRLFKTTYKDRNGKTRTASKWYVEFRDQLDTVRRLPAFTSKAASEEFGRNVVKLVAYHKGSGGQVDPSLTRWLAGLAQRTRDKLVAIGLLDPERVAVSKSLVDHLADWTEALKAKACSRRHVELIVSRTRRVIDGCAFKYYGDITGSKVLVFLNDLRADSEEKRGISNQTFNFYLQAVKQFCRWMVKDRRAAESAVAHLDGLNVKTDRRRDRRALSVEELRALLEAAQSGPEQFGLTGADRALLYWLAVETGLRSNELRSLTCASFDLDTESATVTVEAAYSKRRREDILLLRPALAEALKTHLATKLPGANAFPIPDDRKKAAAMFRADLEAAGIGFRNSEGLVADFHSLRHTFITNLANGGVHPKTAQSLARHCTISLTMDRYSHTLREQEAEALATLPDLSSTLRQSLAATGTDNATPANISSKGKQSVLASCLALSERFSGTSGGAGGLAEDKEHTLGNPAKHGENMKKTEAEGVGFEPPAKSQKKPQLLMKAAQNPAHWPCNPAPLIPTWLRSSTPGPRCRKRSGPASWPWSGRREGSRGFIRVNTVNVYETSQSPAKNRVSLTWDLAGLSLISG
jgi:integrase